MYSFDRQLLSLRLGALRVREYSVSKAAMVPGLRGWTLVDQAHLSLGSLVAL